MNDQAMAVARRRFGEVPVRVLQYRDEPPILVPAGASREAIEFERVRRALDALKVNPTGRFVRP